MKQIIFILLFLFLAPGKMLAQDSNDNSAKTAKELIAITQKLLDAIVTGDKTVWEQYMANNGFITEEDGVVRNKEEQLQFMRPASKGFTRSLILTNPTLRQYQDMAVLSITPKERLEINGQVLNTSYNETDVFIKVKGEWQLLACQVAEIIVPPASIEVGNEVLASYAGTYRVSDDLAYVISFHDGGLMAQRSGRDAQALLAETDNVFFTREQPARRRIFVRDKAGKVIQMIDRRAGNDLVYIKVR
jgi:hypothetical protein